MIIKSFWSHCSGRGLYLKTTKIGKRRVVVVTSIPTEAELLSRSQIEESGFDISEWQDGSDIQTYEIPRARVIKMSNPID